MNKTFSAKPTDVTRSWYLVDASTVPLGRLSTVVASLLIGKGKPQFTKHIDCGDFVVVTNASNLVVSGKKTTDKMYYHHSHYPGGLKALTLNEQMDKDPAKIVMHAVRGMLPVNKLRDDRLKRLKIYNDASHQHEAQKPQMLNLKRTK